MEALDDPRDAPAAANRVGRVAAAATVSSNVTSTDIAAGVTASDPLVIAALSPPDGCIQIVGVI